LEYLDLVSYEPLGELEYLFEFELESLYSIAAS
jgi:hypothetical protein